MAAEEYEVLLEADLLVDTAVAGRQHGVRSGLRDGRRQLLYRSGELFLDLQLSGSPGGGSHDLIGQLLAGVSAGPLADLPVRLELEGGGRVSTRSDQLGEFHLAAIGMGSATIEVELERHARLEIPLPADLLLAEGEE